MQRRLIAAAIAFGMFGLIAIAVSLLGTPRFDFVVDEHAAALRDGVFGTLLHWLSTIGYAGWFAPIVIVIVVLLTVLGRSAAAIEVAAAAVLANVVFVAFKQLFRRVRPEFPEHVVGGYSLPSGHATMACTLATVLLLAVPELRRPWLAIPLVAYAVLTAMSRVVLGVHYTTDVVAGACLGAACALAVDAIVVQRRRG
jgi:undecaprenyl-diphosphatase